MMLQQKNTIPLLRTGIAGFLGLWLLLLLGCANFPSSTVDRSANPDNHFKKGLLWQVEKPGEPPSYVFGSIHSEDPRVTRLPPLVEQHFRQADSLALEVLLNQQSSRAASTAMFFRDGRTLRKVAGERLYQQSVSALSERGFQADHVLMMKPWGVFTVLSMPEPETGLFLDALLFRRAVETGKAVHGLESMAEQVSVFDHMAEEYQVRLLQDTLRNADDIDTLVDKTLQVYLSRDLDALLKLNREYMEFTDPVIAAEVNQRLIVARNHRMVRRMQPLLKEGDVFVAVGALHLPGKEGVLQLLVNRGYQVTPVY